MSGSSRAKLGGFLEPIAHFEGKRAVVSVTKGLNMTNGTRPYESAAVDEIGNEYVAQDSILANGRQHLVAK